MKGKNQASPASKSNLKIPHHHRFKNIRGTGSLGSTETKSPAHSYLFLYLKAKTKKNIPRFFLLPLLPLS